ncbi:MAG: DPP IV N-terminal domain-containing protein [Bacteroidales bacterium]|nr:DPP IV N-terminal domain-containing protein [Bacteroidales bacterium]MBN2698930.1 DPP IV N-terminal domain-containing protein [Bacteroidales bacterium]
MKKIVSGILICLVTVAIPDELIAQKKPYKTLEEAIMSGRLLRGDYGPSNVTWIEDGLKYSFTRRDGRIQEIWTFDPATGSEEMVFSTVHHTFPGTETPFEYLSFEWANNYRYILFQTRFRPIWRYSGNSDYYLYSLDDQSLRLICEESFTAEVSPDGKRVCYGKDGELYDYRFEDGKQTRLTFDAAEQLYNGRFGWAYEEEFGLVQAWNWSPDSKFIAYWQSDEREVPIYKLTDFSAKHPQYMEVPYPKVGDPAPEVRIGVLDVETGINRWLGVDLQGGYIPRIYWTSKEGLLAVLWTNRAQTHIKLFFYDVQTMSGKLIMEEQSDSWIDIYDFWNRKLHFFLFPENREEFFFLSDRNGYTHIYRFDYDGNLLNQVTDGKWEVIGFETMDAGNEMLYYVSNEGNPLERNLYSIRFDGSDKRRLTHAEGNHSVSMAPGGIYFIDRYSSINAPYQVDLMNREGTIIKKLVDNKGVQEYIQKKSYAQTELFQFTTSDGTVIDGSLIKPMNFNPKKKYPLIMDVYGGPGSQEVTNSFGTSSWHQYLAQEGYVIANINNRGNGGYGKTFERIVYKQVGKWETKDFAEAAEYLSSKSWIDAERTGIMGHSYGGFSAGYSLVMHPDVFEAGIATAAVNNQVLYDCIYAERHMGLIEDNPEGYVQSSISAHAGNLKGDLMVVHSLMDDNVHPQNTFQMIRAFLDNGISVDLKIYPPGNHGVAYDMRSRIRLYKDYFEFLEENLK